MSKAVLRKMLEADILFQQQIAAWYLEEWGIPEAQTMTTLHNVLRDPAQLQVMLLLDEVCIATGGVYTKASIQQHVPALSNYGPWLSLVYTRPLHRGKGWGGRVCTYLEDQARDIGHEELYLFTHTAESLYHRLGWTLIERYELKSKNIAVMKRIWEV